VSQKIPSKKLWHHGEVNKDFESSFSCANKQKNNAPKKTSIFACFLGDGQTALKEIKISFCNKKKTKKRKKT